MKAVYYPTSSAENAFQHIVQSGLEAGGFEIESLDSYIKGRGKAPMPVFLNWYDDVSHGNGAVCIIKYLRNSAVIARVLSRGGRIAYVVHNRQPHDSEGTVGFKLSLRLRRQLCRKASCIIVLCDETRNVLMRQLGEGAYDAVSGKIVKVPHPTFTGAYGDSGRDYRCEFGIAADKFLFVFSGLIRPYKGVEKVLDVAERFHELGYDAEFLIAGKCSSKDYEREISIRAGKLSNVHLCFGFIENEDIGCLMEASDALIQPYDIKSSLNSGSCYLAFSYGRTVVSPKIGSTMEFDSGLTYTYEYSTDDGHRDAIIDAATRAYTDWLTDKAAFGDKGRELKRLVDNGNSCELTAQRYCAVAYECMAGVC